MKFGYTILHVQDVLKTVEFYERAFGLKRVFVHESGYAELDTGATKLAFASHELIKSNGFDFGQLRKAGAPAPFEIALVIDDVEGAFAKAVQEGAVELKKPLRKPWGQVVSYVKDPLNEVLIEICSPV
jgi:catechol 2,3-dioxygenase-like lactoylglutathione lyase family enzyme